MNIKAKIMELETFVNNTNNKIANRIKKSSSKNAEVDDLLAKKIDAEKQLKALIKRSMDDSAESGADVLSNEPLDEEVDIDEDVEADLDEDEELEGSGDVGDDLTQAIADILGANFDDEQTVGEVLDALGDGEEDLEDEDEIDFEEPDDEEFEPEEGFEDGSEEHESLETPEEEALEEEFEDEEEDEEGIPEFTVKNAHCKKCKCEKMVKKNGKIMCKECGSQIVITIDLPEGMEIEGSDVEESGEDTGLDTEGTEENIKEIFDNADVEEVPEDGSEEHEEAETPEEEEAEQEDGDDDEKGKKKWNFEKAAYTVKLYKKSDKKETNYVVFKGKTPIFQVKACKAWKDLSAKPEDKELAKYASYYDLFVSKEYKQSLLDHCNQFGWEKTCSLSMGKISKSAQVLPEGTIEQNAQPFPSTTNPGQMQGVPEPQPGDTLNPDQATEDMFDAEAPSKMLVTDVIANLLAIEVANESYTIDEIQTELEAVFSDEAATAEFIGTLQQKADTYKDVVDESKEEEPAPEEELPALDFAAPGMEAGQSENTTPTSTEQPGSPVKAANVMDCEMCGECNKPKGSCSYKEDKDEEIEKQAERINELEDAQSIRFKVASALKFVTDDMIPRGLVDNNNTAISAEVKKLVSMEKQACSDYMEMIKKVPSNKKSEDDEQEEIVKQASIFNDTMGSSPKIPFIERTEVKTGIDALLSDEMFETRLTKVATENGRKTKKSWM